VEAGVPKGSSAKRGAPPERQSIFDIKAIVGKAWIAVVGATVAALLSLFFEEIHAYVSYLFVGGNLRGEYVVRTSSFDGRANKWSPYGLKLVLKHGGTRVFGTESSATSNQTWRVFGYFRPPFLSLAYESNDSAALGTGTYSFKQDLPYVLWGYWIGVECDLSKNQRFLAQCPAIAYRADHPELLQRYENFMSRDCVRITNEPVACRIKNGNENENK
jgi:hypothetical protein